MSSMRAVSNTSPISNLAAIGYLELLRSQFPALWVPEAVAAELSAHPDPAALNAIQRALRQGWMKTAIPQDSPLLRLLRLQLHRGEAQAIALATEIKADIVLIDEQEGRTFAVSAGLAVTGVLGILLRAKRKGEIEAIRPALELLRTKAHFFIGSSLEAEIVAAAGE